jgi:pimeloyl-ACP methyl ester carboxylesterase
VSPTRLPTLPAPRLADVGPATIEYVVSGATGPVIVLVNGAGGPLDGWSRVFGPLLRFGTVVAYNRPGIGRSSRPTEPQTGALIAGTLRDLLTEIGLEPPFILLGHSLGGLYVNLFARMLPDVVAGVVMVEGAHPDDRQMTALQPGWLRAVNSVLGVGNRFRRDRAYGEVRWVDQTCRQFEHAGPFPEVPLAVVSAARRPPARTMPEEVADLRHANQEALVALSPTSRQFHTAGAGHFPQLSEPTVVVDAVRWVIERIASERGGRLAEDEPVVRAYQGRGPAPEGKEPGHERRIVLVRWRRGPFGHDR